MIYENLNKRSVSDQNDSSRVTIAELREILSDGKKSGSNRKVQHERDLQIQCVSWFRMKYPAFSMLLFHPANETSEGVKKLRMRAAEGVVAGVCDLILAIPSSWPVGTDRYDKYGKEIIDMLEYSSLGIEMKFGKTNNQSAKQKLFEQYYKAAGNKYCVCRNFDDFKKTVDEWMTHVPNGIKAAIKSIYSAPDDYNKQILKRITQKK